MSKPQNTLMKILQQLGIARFLGLMPTEKKDDAKVSSEPAPQDAPESSETPITTVSSNIDSSVAAKSEAVEAHVEAIAEVAEPVSFGVSKAEAPTPESVSELASNTVAITIPEDSVLRRHYLATQQAERDALTQPYPADSVLRRHYDTQHRLVLDDAGITLSVSEAVEPSSVAGENQPTQATIIEKVVEKAPVHVDPSPAACTQTRLLVPQDSVLKRHFLQCLQAEIEAGLSPTPTDSVLRRHHVSLVAAELQKRLAN